MNNKYSKLISIFILIMSPVSCFANTSYTCPAKIHLDSASVSAGDIPAGFVSSVSRLFTRITGVSVFDGPPDEVPCLNPHWFQIMAMSSPGTLKVPIQQGSGCYVIMQMG